MKRFFITGTDTNCGKTYVTCQLLHYFNRKNLPALALKPIASGVVEQEGRLFYEDIEFLQRNNDDQSLDITQWRFEAPISPHLAAANAGVELSSQHLIEFCDNPIYAGREYQFIEGAGGLMAPLNPNETWVDFLKSSKIPVILVVGMRLGCLNHTLLTVSVLEAHHIVCAGWVANCIDKDMLELEANIQTLTDKLKCPLLARIPFQGNIQSLQL